MGTLRGPQNAPADVTSGLGSTQGVVWCGVVQCGVVWCGVVWCGVVWRGAQSLWICHQFSGDDSDEDSQYVPDDEVCGAL